MRGGSNTIVVRRPHPLWDSTDDGGVPVDDDGPTHTFKYEGSKGSTTGVHGATTPSPRDGIR